MFGFLNAYTNATEALFTNFPPPMTKVTYHFHGQARTIDADPDKSISKNAVLHGIPFTDQKTCKGKGKCGLCAMKIAQKGEDPHMKEPILGCQIKPVEGMEVVIG